MVVACAVCRRCKDVYARICFHTFPFKDEKRMEAWCSAMNLPRERVSKNSRLCSVHFTADSYKESVINVYSKKLKKGAVPSIINMSDEEIIMIASVNEETESSKVKKNDCEKEQLKMEVVTDVGEKDKQTLENGSENEIMPVESLESLSCDNNLAKMRSSVEDDNLENDECGTKLKNIKTAKWEDVSHLPSLSKAAFEEAKDSIHDLEKKLQAERVRNCRLKKIAKSFRTLMADLKENKFVTQETAKKLEQSMPPVAQEIMRRMLTRSKNGAFPTALKSFATTLHFYSPKGYDYVRKNFLNSLPHTSTIRKWYQSVDGTPGICSEAIVTLGSKAKKAKEKNKDLYFNVTVDDMHIKRHIEWDGKKYSGYEDFGGETPTGKDKPETNEVEQKEATNAMVVMAVGVNENVKIAVGYFFIHSLTGEQRAELVKKCFVELESAGIQTIGLTFDGTVSNITMGEALGAKLRKIDDLQPYFYHPTSGKKFFIILDACHMIKLVRNALGDTDITHETNCDKDNKENDCDNSPKFKKKGNISWKYIERLLQIQKSQGLHAATKVRRRHLNYLKEKMKVKLAVQVFSASVASALRYLKRKLRLPEFQDCEATANFCQILNDIFDLLNSRNRFCKEKSKRCIDKNNIDEVRSKIAFYIQYISELKIGNKSVLESPKKTGFLGMIITMQSVLGIYDEYVATGNSSFFYLLTYKLSQDHLELFFSAVRSRGGNNNNPTTIQFQAVFKKLLIHTELKGSEFANCTMQDETIFLHVGRTNSKKKTDGFDSIGEIDTTESLPADILAEHDYYTEDVFKSANMQYIKDVIGYIAGFIVRKLERIITCEKCLKQITATTSLSLLQKGKCRGGLKSASFDVIKICEIAEKQFRMINVLQKKDVLNYLTTMTFRNIPSHILDSDSDHIFDQGFLSDHRTQLIKLIIVKYLTLRLKKLATAKNDEEIRIRHHLTKTILFKNQ